MSGAKLDLGGVLAEPRRRRSAEERRLIVEETLEAGVSVARVARKYGVNANQVFYWRRLYQEGQLGGDPQGGLQLLPVRVTEDAEPEKTEPAEAVFPAVASAIHIELLGGVRISLEGCVDPEVVRAVLESLRS
jgi:transposase